MIYLHFAGTCRNLKSAQHRRQTRGSRMSEEQPLPPPPPPEKKDISDTMNNALDDSRFYLGLIMGLLLGILGNLVVSFLMETIHAFDTALFYPWLSVFLVILVTTFFVFRWLAIRFLQPFLDVFYIFFPSRKPKGKKRKLGL
jgi:hypothetical protein